MAIATRATTLALALVSIASAGLTLAACGTAGEEEGPNPFGGFISDDPNRNALDNDDGSDAGAPSSSTSSSSSSSGAGGAGGGTGEGDPGVEAPDPEKVIAEADIVQIHDGLLYALSEFSGLNIIDVSVPDQLQLIGHQQLPGRPFEMYLRDGVIYAMFESWGRYVELDDGWQWVEMSHLEALNVTAPNAIESVGSFDLPGVLADSRMVGDVIYVVTFEDGYCWQCDTLPNTTVTSLAVANPSEVAVVDELAFTDPDGNGGSWRRSISVTTDRMYVGGVDWGDGFGGTSDIQVIDISNPNGTLVLGDSVEVAGQIRSRWQMSEYQGVLRVVSQPWDPTVNPRVQTFTIVSSAELTALGQTELQLPQPESLRAVRFDGDKAYAITAEVVVGDPLYTIDLSNPAAPQMVGMLEMPGWVYHIEPRGDRLLALGFDEQNPEGSLNVSLFDVSNLATPTLKKRVHFGGDWGSFAEDQDRIHKAFKILPEIHLILVPYAAWEWNESGCSTYHSGIQLVDTLDDDISLRGVAPVRGEARRAFMHEGRLFAMSDEQIRTFDIEDRDAPAKVTELMMSAKVNQVVVSGEHLVRMAADWWTREPRLEVVSLDQPEVAHPLGSVDLGPMLAVAEQDDSCYHWSYWEVRLFAHGQSVFLVWPSWGNETARVAAVDLSDPTQPRLGPHLDVPVDSHSYYGYYWSYAPSLLAAGEPVAQVGSTLAFLRVDAPLDEWGYPDPWAPGTSHAASLRIVDLSNVDAPKVAATVQLPTGGGHTGLVAEGQRVLLSHWEPVPLFAGKARFFFDRIDVSNPAAPLALPPINVPGSLVAYDRTSGNLLAADYQREVLADVTRAQCSETFGYGADFVPHDDGWWTTNQDWDAVRGQCRFLHRKLKLAHVDELGGTAHLLDSHPLPDDLNTSELLVGDDRVFFTSRPQYTYEQDDSESQVWVIGGLREGELIVRTEGLDGAPWAWWRPVEAEGQRLVAWTWSGGVVSVDASNLDSLKIQTHEAVSWSISSAEIEGDQAFLSLGSYGVRVVDLTEVPES